MGKVDYCSLYLCGIRMNGVLIEWNSWLGYFIYTYIQKCCILYYNSAVGIQVTWIKLDRKKNEYPI
jgi:hypothetical protein